MVTFNCCRNMHKLILVHLFTTIPASYSVAQVSDSLAYYQTNWKENVSSEGMISYECLYTDMSAYSNENLIGLHTNKHYLGYEQSVSSKWSKGSAVGIRLNWLIGEKDEINKEIIKLKGFRFGIHYGYKLKLFEFLTVEPNLGTEYGNFRIKNKTTGAKLKTHGINLCGNLDIRIMFKPQIDTYETGMVTPLLSFSFGYLYNPVNTGWNGTTDSKLELSAPQFAWSGWCFKIKLGMIES